MWEAQVDCRVLIDVVGYNKHHLARGAREGNNPENAAEHRSRPLASHPYDCLLPPPDAHGVIFRLADDLLATKPKQDLESALTAKRLDEEAQQRNRKIMLEKEEDLMFMLPFDRGLRSEK